MVRDDPHLGMVRADRWMARSWMGDGYGFSSGEAGISPLCDFMPGADPLTEKTPRPTLVPDDQKRFRLPGVGLIRINVAKHVEQALKKQSYDFAEHAKAERARNRE